MSRRSVTVPRFETPNGTYLRARVRFDLVDSRGRTIIGVVSPGQETVADQVEVFSAADYQLVELTVTEDLSPWTQYRITIDVDDIKSIHYAQVPAGAQPMTWVELIAGGELTDPADISALQLHLSDDDRHLLTDERDALIASASPSAVNAIATMADIIGAGGGNVSKVGTPVNDQVGVWTGDGTIEGTTALTFNGTALDLTGSITVSGTVDGRDLATDGTKLDGVEVSADVTDETNVIAALDGATITEVASESGDFFLFQDTSDSGAIKKIDHDNLPGGGGGGGDVTKVGTPVNDQIGVWTGDGTLEGSSALTFNGAALDLTGNLTLSGTVDGRDVAADGAKLDGVEALADVTDTSNVTAAGALMDSEVDADLKTFSLPASTTISAFGATLVDDAAASNARSTLGLGTAAVVATDLSDLNEATIETAIDTLANLTSVQGLTVTLADAAADAIWGWDDTAGAYENLTAAEVRAVINVEDGADVTDETNVVSALNGATITETGAQSGDFFFYWDTSDGGNVKKVDWDDMPGAGGGIGNVVEDTTPQLGGDLDLNSNDITGTGGINITGNIALSGTVDGRDIATDGTKLDGVEAGATGDQSNAEIKTAYEANADTNAFTDAEQTLLGNQSGTNTGDESAASTTAAGVVELATIAEVDTGTDTTRAITPDALQGSALQTKLDGIEAGADITDTTNVTAAGAFMDSENLPVTQLNSGTNASSATFWRGDETWATPAGSGDVSKVGTPVNDQIGVWTGDGTIEGTSALTFNGAALDLTGNLTLSGTVDGRDISADGTELDSFDDDLATFSLPASTTISSFGATLIDDAAASNARTTLGLGSAAEVATDLADLNEATIEAAIDTLANLTSVQGLTVTLADAGADAIFGWDDTTGAYENLTAAEVQAAINVDDGATNDLFTATNNNAGAVTIGMAVYADGSGTIDLAQADAASTDRAVGLVADASIASSGSGNIQHRGILYSADWTAVIGSTNLTAAADYFLSAATAGLLTATAPTTATEFVVYVGHAISTTELLIAIERPIGL